MGFLNVEALSPFISLALACLFLGTLFYLARLNERVTAMRGAQSELRGVLRACSDQVDGAEKAITNLRNAAQQLAGELGGSLDEAARMKAEIDATCAGVSAMLARLEAGMAPADAPAQPAQAGAGRQPAGPPPSPPGMAKPASAATAASERAALRLFRETIRAL